MSAVDVDKKTRVDVEKLTRVFVIFWGWSLVIEKTVFGLRNFAVSFPLRGFSEQNGMLSFLVKYIFFLPFVLMFLFSGTLIGVLLICFHRQLAGFLTRRAERPASLQTVATWKFREIHAMFLAVFGIWCVIYCAEQLLIGYGFWLHIMIVWGMVLHQEVGIDILPLLIPIIIMLLFLPLIVWARPITRKINQIATIKEVWQEKVF